MSEIVPAHPFVVHQSSGSWTYTKSFSDIFSALSRLTWVSGEPASSAKFHSEMTRKLYYMGHAVISLTIHDPKAAEITSDRLAKEWVKDREHPIHRHRTTYSTNGAVQGYASHLYENGVQISTSACAGDSYYATVAMFISGMGMEQRLSELGVPSALMLPLLNLPILSLPKQKDPT